MKQTIVEKKKEAVNGCYYDKNIDKDIEILKEVQGIFEHLKIYGWINDIKRDVDTDKAITSIENVLKELEKYKKAYELETYERQKFIEELETYKKIAELMASQINNYDAQLVINRFRSKEEVIDWARKEVEK